MHILIVEDDERIVSFMKRGLEAESYEVSIASSKAQTLALTEAYTYDVIIMDIFLGQDDGLDICRTLRSNQVPSIILIMTAKGTGEIEASSKNAGANAYLAKPFSFDDLVDTIAHLQKASAPSDTVRTVPAAGIVTPEDQVSVFTNSDKLRPINTSVADSDVQECSSTSTSPVWGRQ